MNSFFQKCRGRLKVKNFALHAMKLNQTKKAAQGGGHIAVVREGIEPPTQGFSVLCSTD